MFNPFEIIQMYYLHNTENENTKAEALAKCVEVESPPSSAVIPRAHAE